MDRSRAAYLERMQQHLKTAYLLSDEKVVAMTPVFVNTLRSHMDRLMELATSGDIQQLGRASHAVKGALLNIGLTDLAETAYTIEKQCKVEDNTLDYQAMIAELQYTVSLFAED
jgi:HPt (histidine-containing phosphotransfer) domain-containing protein